MSDFEEKKNFKKHDFEEQNTFRMHDFEKSFFSQATFEKYFAHKKSRFDSVYPYIA